MNKLKADPTCNCPTCKTPIAWSNRFPFRPFCSERCKLIDLGEWASEGHRIAGEPVCGEVPGAGPGPDQPRH
ncbi:DNA gyrase inhibitor YacG [Microbulbifer sp. 2205BS26-8]|uniref:DNA gyrase inhibitor YacG n=1 Tax=Microbulbifer sp. 2205BS26-8 TaxID=3064386 RepID=UPI00273D711F|nr:DNA gyrase inhibitor YacG [Microbulbifer sp. 2205BS26-8]MDP5208994.1 DNA gyrase inhibitor YacG [Microbulbifer sp. 2205BS26-8]